MTGLPRNVMNRSTRRNFMHATIARGLGAAALAAMAGLAHAEVKEAGADHFVLAYSKTLDVAPAKVFAAIASVERWWNGQHSFSGDASNLSMKAEAGSCFCERWKDNTVEHARVLMVIRDQAFRMAGAFGPLQGMAVNAVLSIGTRAEGSGTVLTMVYRVNGVASSALDKLAPDVDQVIGEQFARLASYAATGKPTAP
jgi:uncharacterized protein YndB with AHSA1/START domain